MIKKYMYILGLFILVGSLRASLQTNSFIEAKRLAAENNKPILIDFMTEW